MRGRFAAKLSAGAGLSLFVFLFILVPGGALLHDRSGRDLVPEKLELQLIAAASVVSAATVRVETHDGLGSGTIVTPEGHILTSAHVVESSAACTVTLSDGRRFAAAIGGINGSGDLALLKIEATNLTVAPLGESDRLELHGWVLAAGHPTSAFDDFQPTLSLGVIHELRGFIRTNDESKVFSNVIVNDAPISPGSSGGGLWDLEGRLVGVNAAVTQNENRGFAVRISEFIHDRTRLMAGERFNRRPDRHSGRRERRSGDFSRAHYFDARLPDLRWQLAARTVLVRSSEGVYRGFVVSPAGHVLTVARPLAGAAGEQKVVVELADGASVTAKVAGLDRINGVALLELPPAAAAYACFDLARSATQARGALAFTVGREGLTGGMVSVVHRIPPLALTGEVYYPNVMQVDLRLSVTQNGAAVVGRSGELHGIVVQHRLTANERRQERDPYGAFVLPAELLRESYELLRRGVQRGQRSLGFLGADLHEMTEHEKESRGVPGGVVVGSSFWPRGPALTSGIRAGDVIVSIGGDPVVSRASAIARIVSCKRGERVPFVILQKGESKTIVVEMAERDDYR